MESALLTCTAAGILLMGGLAYLRRRLDLSAAKHPSAAGHARLARVMARLVRFYEFGEEEFLSVDGAPVAVVERRRAGFLRLVGLYARRFAESARMTTEVEESVSDLEFVNAYRVPFPFSRVVREHLRGGAFAQSSSGVTITDLDGNVFYDLTGAYGVNVFGYDFYKECMDRGVADARGLGPVLGPYHPAIAYNVRRLREISGLDEVSFHMSGTEAVMQAVRLARYHTGRSRLVRFCGAYHGWWGDVQPGVGNPLPATDTFTLRDIDARSLRVLRTRRDIACVLVNPLQALHPNSNPRADNALVGSARNGHFDRAAYADWLRQLRSVCDERGIVLILDEIFVGFRLAAGGAQEYFGVRADLATYGKTVGGGLPIGVVCGRRDLMKRYRKERPADICFARGTFNAHPYVMATMAEFLRRLDSAEASALYRDQDEVWNRRARSLNERFEAERLPIRVANMSSIWAIGYGVASRYNWMLQFYLRAEGLALSWVGTGRLIFSLNYTDADFEAVAERILRAARAMEQDGWWWASPTTDDWAIRGQIVREMWARRRVAGRRARPTAPATHAARIAAGARAPSGR